jgi:hypothetical protein
LAVPGFKSAQRFELVSEPVPNALPYRYCATYEVATEGNPQEALDEMLRRVGTDTMPMSEAMDTSSYYAVLYEPITPVVRANKG